MPPKKRVVVKKKIVTKKKVSATSASAATSASTTTSSHKVSTSAADGDGATEENIVVDDALIDINDNDAGFDMMMDDDDEDEEIVMFPEDAEGENAWAPMASSSSGSQRIRVTVGGTQQPVDDESDSSEDEAPVNRVGDIPLEWYEDEEHMGYDIDGKKVMKPSRGDGDGDGEGVTLQALEELLDKTDDPNAMRTIIDPTTGEKKILTNKDLALIFNLQRNKTPNPEYKSMYEDYEWTPTEFDPLNHPMAGSGPSKATFVPKKNEMKKLAKWFHRMRKEEERKAKLAEDGEVEEDEKTQEEKEDQQLYLLWDDDAADAKKNELDAKARFRAQHYVPKPKVPPPGTYESYRPPPEYLPSAATRERFNRTRRIDRKEHFLPQQFGALRHVPAYNHFIQDRYQRCLDLAFFPRMQRTRLVVDPKELLPELPNARDLRPFPERLSFLYKGHTATVRSISLSPNGQYLATGCDDHLVRIFEVATGRLCKRYDVGAPVQQLAFSPNPTHNILAVAVDFALLFIVPSFCAHKTVSERSVRFLRAPGSVPLVGDGNSSSGVITAGEVSMGGRGITQLGQDLDETAYKGDRDLDDAREKEKRAEFLDANASERSAGIVVKIVMHARVKRFTFHHRGDYLCALCPKDHVKYRQTIMLQLSGRKVFCPFRKFAEIVTDCSFHPTRPEFLLSTTNQVRVYNLVQHKLIKRYKAPGGVTTCVDPHPGGDNFLVGDTTNHTLWYDCDLSDKPYKRMTSHKSVVNAVRYHPNTNAWPLFASASSDGQVHVMHATVYDDYNKNALIVPVKILKHTRPVYDLCWHPSQPWVFTSTEDGTVCCWTE